MSNKTTCKKISDKIFALIEAVKKKRLEKVVKSSKFERQEESVNKKTNKELAGYEQKIKIEAKPLKRDIEKEVRSKYGLLKKGDVIDIKSHKRQIVANLKGLKKFDQGKFDAAVHRQEREQAKSIPDTRYVPSQINIQKAAAAIRDAGFEGLDTSLTSGVLHPSKVADILENSNFHDIAAMLRKPVITSVDKNLAKGDVVDIRTKEKVDEKNLPPPPTKRTTASNKFWQQAKVAEKKHITLEKPKSEDLSKTDKQDAKVATVMREYKKGGLHSGSKEGPIVKNRKQAIAIALSQVGLAKADPKTTNQPKVQYMSEPVKHDVDPTPTINYKDLKTKEDTTPVWKKKIESMTPAERLAMKQRLREHRDNAKMVKPKLEKSHETVSKLFEIFKNKNNCNKV